MTQPLPSRAAFSQILKHLCSSLAFIIAATFTVWAQCPEKTNDPNFVEGEVYYVDIDVRLRNTPVEGQFRRGLESWNFANKHVNKTGTEFKVITNWNEVPPGANLLHVSEKAFAPRPDGSPDSTPARMEPVRREGVYLREATVFFNTNSLANTATGR